jgi:hypothetical protein
VFVDVRDVDGVSAECGQQVCELGGSRCEGLRKRLLRSFDGALLRFWRHVVVLVTVFM